MEKTNSMRRLDALRIPYQVVEFSPDIHSADGVAAAVGLPASQVFKTLVVIRPPKKPLLIMVPGDRDLDLRRTAQAIGEKKIAMATQNEAESLTGLLVGGISALAVPEGRFVVYIDRSALGFDEVLVSAGKRGVNLRLKTKDLIGVTGARVIEAVPAR
jgi:Cys-tRNA(Pro)/Cys-tRNA(Cys) deacylase